MTNLLRIQNIVLEMIACGANLRDTASRLCLEVEGIIPDAACSILTVDASGLLQTLSAPSLPSNYSQALNGLLVGPNIGSCGTAAFTGKPVLAKDIETDPLWKDFRQLVDQIAYKACWSTPIRNGCGAVIGTFAFYYRGHRGPTKLEKDIVDACVHLCAIALERDGRVRERERLAYVDALTGLPNRAGFNAALDAMDCGHPGSWAMLAIDLDNLKVVNDSFGHHSGDMLLQGVAKRLAHAALPDRSFRIGGDEFAVIVQSPDALGDLESFANDILSSLSPAIEGPGHSIHPRATIGGAVVSASDHLPNSVRQNADHALYHAKEIGRGGFVRYWPGLGTSITQRLSVIQEVAGALKEGRIETYYQPVVRLDTEDIVGVEALCRMKGVDGKVRTAGEFFEALSDRDIAQTITDVMLANVAQDVRHWLDQGIPFQHVGLNISSGDFYRSLPLHDYLGAALARTAVPMEHLIVEVTEGVYLDERSHDVSRQIGQLRSNGFKVALDDFGTGFASLTHLLTVPVDFIKIDKSFVSRLQVDGRGAAIIDGLASISEKLGMRMLAEGVETDVQARQLLALGCRMGQGFLYSPAVDRQQMTQLLHLHAEGGVGRRAPDEARHLPSYRRLATKD